MQILRIITVPIAKEEEEVEVVEVEVAETMKMELLKIRTIPLRIRLKRLQASLSLECLSDSQTTPRLSSP